MKRALIIFLYLWQEFFTLLYSEHGTSDHITIHNNKNCVSQGN